MKTYCVTYRVTTCYDAAVKAESRKEAIEKVKEVIGDPVEITGVWETKGSIAVEKQNG